MGGWGGVIASALAGGTAGAMSSVAKDIDEQQKAALQAQRDQRLAELARETHKINAQASAQVDIETAGPKAKAISDAKAATAEQDAATVNKVSDLTRPSRTADQQATEDTKYNKYGNEVWKGGKKIGTVEKDPEDERRAKELHDARVESLTAGAEAKRAAASKLDRSGEPKDPKEPKTPKIPDSKWKQVEGQDGVFVDDVTGWRRVEIPAVKAKPEETNWRGKVIKEAVPEQKARVEFQDSSGKPVTPEQFEAKRREHAGIKPDTTKAGVVDSGAPVKLEAKAEEKPAEKPAAKPAAAPSFDEVKRQADAALAKPGANVAAIKARFKQITGKDYR